MLFLTEQDVQELFPMAEAIERVQASLTAQARGQAINRSRERIFLPHTSLHYMAAALAEEHLVGIKIYTASRDAVRFLVLLYDGTTGQLLCALEADHLGRSRTGAASAVATRYLARADATRVGLIGAGRQARTQLEAVAQVREITAARVFGRDAAKLREFCREMTEGLHLEVDCSIVNWPCRTSSSEQMKRDLARPGLMLQRYLSPAGHWRGCLYKGAQFEIRSFGAAR